MGTCVMGRGHNVALGTRVWTTVPEKSARAHRRWWRAVRASKYRRASFDATTATVCSAPSPTVPASRSGLSAESQRCRTTLQKASGSQIGHVKRTASQGRIATERHAIILRVHSRCTRAVRARTHASFLLGISRAATLLPEAHRFIPAVRNAGRRSRRPASTPASHRGRPDGRTGIMSRAAAGPRTVATGQPSVLSSEAAMLT